MTVRYSTGLRDHQAVTGSMKSALDGMQLDIYAGATIPATADAALPGDATLLLTFTASGSGLTFVAGGNGMLKKATDETWTGTVLADGTAAFFRLHASSDDNSESTSIHRVQGEVAAIGSDLNMTAGTELETGTVITLNSFVMSFLAA